MALGSRKGGELTLQQIFLLLAALNGVVLGYLVYSAWTVLRDPSSNQLQAQTTIFLAVLLAIGVSISYRIVAQRVTKPLRQLLNESYAIAWQGSQSNAYLNLTGGVEIVRLAEAINHLLKRQREANAELASLNQQLRAVNQKVDESIRYAALLQDSILPTRRLESQFGADHFVLWLPRDQVGGDYYLFHDSGRTYLTGVADCAGHGVSGAMMTMLARVGIERSIQQIGLASPAAVLTATHDGMREVLGEAMVSRALATTMDAGLVVFDTHTRQMLFAGARIALYWSDGVTVGSIKGESRSLWDRRPGVYRDHEVPVSDALTYYLTTDGLLDQAGGAQGYGLGTELFQEWILAHSQLPLPAQATAFTQALNSYQGAHPRRDDITLLAFRVR